MILPSIGVGILFGALWGTIFTGRYKHYSQNASLSIQSNPSSFFLASTSTIRYLLLAGILIMLIIRFNLQLHWWLAGFMTSFWLLLIKTQTNHKNTLAKQKPSIKDTNEN